MNAKELLGAGKVRDAEKALSAYLRDNPADAGQRTFLFELLCFAGQYERASKHLGVLAKSSPEAEMGAVLYYSALHAEQTRHAMFLKQDYPKAPARPSAPGKLNGKPFQSIRDADPEIGARLELYAAGAYLWIPFQHIVSIQMEAPKCLRDTLWAPALVLTGPSFNGTDIGQVIIPAIYPFSWKSDDESLWLGRSTQWVADDEGHEFPVGQKMFIVDDDEVPLLEIRSLEFASDATA
ncbi:MAG TPA: type VI secretion system accessory protein TagJ [Candidatus Acidoferrales bacterium]|jgi:type VI secretion system protein ImpE|nr:type VI secretion system accessory protein TagJ [Candidatus Acidoferrales bacterium]